MANITSKVASYSSVLYYFKQSYINWKYYADDRRRDYIGINANEFPSLLSCTKIEYINRTPVLSSSVAQYIDEEAFFNNLVYTDVSISLHYSKIRLL